jgi:hypothetical protein
LSLASPSVSNRPIWLVEAASRSTALPPTSQRIAGSRPNRSYSSGVGRLYAEDLIVKIVGVACTMIVSV